MDYQVVTQAIVPVFLLIAVGFGARRFRILTEESDGGLMRLVVNILYPALIFKFVLGNEALHDPANLTLAPIVGFVSVCLGFGVAWLAGPIFGLQVGSGRRTFAFCNGIHNYGYIPIPIIAALYPGNGTTGVLLVHNVGIEIAMWSIGILIISASFAKEAWRKLINMPVIALSTGLLLNALGWSQLPLPLNATINFLAACAIPMGIILAGATLSDLSDRSLLQKLEVPLGACLLRLAVLPLLFLLIAKYLPGTSLELRRVIVIQAAMPAGIFPIVIARHYNGDARVATQVVIGTTLLGLITIPLWIGFGLRWVGV